MAKDRKDDLFRRSFEAGAAFLDMTRERAEALVKDLVKAGEVNKGKAQKLVDEVLERSRKSTEDLRDMIRRELTEQVSALGLATKDDIARVEARIEEMGRSGGAAPAGTAGPASTPTATKGAPVKRSPSKKASGATPPMTPEGPVSPESPAAKAATKAPPRKSGGTGAKTGGAAAKGPGGTTARKASAGTVSTGDAAGGAGATGGAAADAGTTPTGGPPADGPAQG